MTKGPPMADETEREQLIPPSFRVANKVVAAHYRLTFLNSLESTGDLREPKRVKPCCRYGLEDMMLHCRRRVTNCFKIRLKWRILFNYRDSSPKKKKRKF